MAKMGAEWAVGRGEPDRGMIAHEVEAQPGTAIALDSGHFSRQQPPPLLEPTYELKLSDLFDEPLEVLEGVSVVLKAEKSPMTIRGYQFVQYVTGHRTWVYIDLVWGVGVQPWLIADSSAVRQINGGITTLLQRAGYTNKPSAGRSFNVVEDPTFRRHEVAQSKEEGWDGYRYRFFDLTSTCNLLIQGAGRWDDEVGYEDGLPYLDLHFDNSQPTRLNHPDGYLLRRSQWPYLEQLIGKKLITVGGQLVSQEVADTYHGCHWVEWAAEVLEPTPPNSPGVGKLTDNKLRVYANLPGFVTMDTELAPIELNPDEWVLLKCESLLFSDEHPELSPAQLRKYFENPIEKYCTRTGKMCYVWIKPADSFEWELIESKKFDEEDHIVTLQPKYSGWFADLLRWLGLLRV